MGEISPAIYRAGEGEPLVLLHGFTGAWSHWRPVLAPLVARYEVIAPTLAGHLGGPPKPDVVTIAGAGDALERQLDELGVSTAHFAGNSMGGALSLEMAKRGRARSVVALSPGGGWDPNGPEPERISRFFTRMVRMTKAAMPRAPLILRRPLARQLVFRDVMRHGELVAPPDGIELMRATLGCTVVDDVLAALRDGKAETEDLEAVSAPTLIAWAQYDRILPMALHAPRFRREIPGVDFRVLARVGHVPMWDDSSLVADTIAGWVDLHTPGVETAPVSVAGAA
jgi:pimeloyl-ACP methyl ester carboxylesterase